MSNFFTALDALFQRRPKPLWFRTREWQTVAPAFRQRSFFSATVTSAKVLTKMREMMMDWMQQTVEQVQSPNTGRLETVYKVGGLADFREKATDFLIEEGVVDPNELMGNNKITNPAGISRLQLIFNTNAEQAATFADWQTKMSNPDFLRANPAARFVRREGARIKRPLHVANENVVKRWDDPFWLRMNAADIGGFEVPWGPYGFNSYMVQRPVKRAEAEKLRVIRKGEVVKAPDVKHLGVDLGKQFNANVESDIDDVTPEIRQQAIRDLRDRLGPQAVTADGKVTLDALKEIRRRYGITR